ncbi:MAG: C40 family peptidase [Sulfurovum sp.]|nr:C40 family peptidase [Sulfurovum sp.]
MKQTRTILPNRLALLHKVLLTLSFTAVSTHAATHTVKHGDSLYKIAGKNHTTVEKIQNANGMKKGDVLKLGRVIKVPTDKLSSTDKKKSSLSKALLASLSNSNKFTSVAKTKLGKRYVWGASGRKNTYDCSSFTKYVYRKNGISIPRTSINQSKHGKYVKRCDLKKGDLIFFDTSKKRKGYVNHVGIYLGNNKFIHASSAKKKVIITSLSKKFYSQRYKGARRPL